MSTVSLENKLRARSYIETSTSRELRKHYEEENNQKVAIEGK